MPKIHNWGCSSYYHHYIFRGRLKSNTTGHAMAVYSLERINYDIIRTRGCVKMSMDFILTTRRDRIRFEFIVPMLQLKLSPSCLTFIALVTHKQPMKLVQNITWHRCCAKSLVSSNTLPINQTKA